MKRKRILMAFIGVFLTGVSIAIFRKALLGVDPFTCFATGFENITGIRYSLIFTIVTGALLVIVFFLDKHFIGIATALNLFGIGVVVEMTAKVLNSLLGDMSIGGRAFLLAAGIVILCFASSLYFTADLGVSAYDAISLIMAKRTKIAFRLCRIATDILCVLFGLIFKANIGVATVITALFMGPLIQFFNVHISEPFLHKNVKQ